MAITIKHGEKSLTMPHIMDLDVWVFEKFKEVQKLARAAGKLQKKLEGLEEKLEELSKSEVPVDKLKETVKEEYLKVREELQDKAEEVTDSTIDFIKALISRYSEYEKFTLGYSINDHKDLIAYLGKETGEFEFVSGSEDFLP
jgi:chromosome segregation ATPase